MFGKKKAVTPSANHDMELLMQAMDQIIEEQNYSEIDTSEFDNPAYGQKLNALIHAFKRSNNNFVLRLNEAMASVGDNSYVKNTLDQVQSQTESIAVMQEASQNLENSISNISDGMAHIRDNTHEMLSIMQDSTTNMNESIHVVNESSEKISAINDRVQEFQDKVRKIGEIVDVVKEVASESNLLALNASIEAARAGEAGKGFAVVAEQVRQLSNNSSESAEDIIRYVADLTNDIRNLAQSMNDTTTKLEQGNEKVQYSLSNIEKMSDQMIGIKEKVDTIFDDINLQSNVTRDFSKQVTSISQSYEELSKDCMEQGKHEHKCSRYIDTTRSDMVRGFAEITQQDWMNIFQTDHFILMWRIYNNIVGFEQLKITQMNNPDGCKLGLWIGSQTNPDITGSKEFAALKAAHIEFHRLATESWKAKDSGNIELALEYFDKTHDYYYACKEAIDNMKVCLRRFGMTDETKIVVFRN